MISRVPEDESLLKSVLVSPDSGGGYGGIGVCFIHRKNSLAFFWVSGLSDRNVA